MPVKAPRGSFSPSYFLVAVSTRENLELCVKHALAGFLSGENGAWTYSELEKGDFVSFLYGARAYNLYRVIRKEAIQAPENLPPWEPLSFKEGGPAYTFPFRLYLQPIRAFAEPIVRTEFSYVAENLLLRGGYRKTHFQADQTTLQSVSEMGTLENSSAVDLPLPPHTVFTPRFTQNTKLIDRPQVFRFQETILQSAVRRHLLSESNLNVLLSSLEIEANADSLEILGEKALMRGHIDLLVKHRVPMGASLKIPIEVKTKRAQPKDVIQLLGYMDELRGECPVGLLIASDFGKQTATSASANNVRLVRYKLSADLRKAPTFEEIYRSLTIEPLGK